MRACRSTSSVARRPSPALSSCSSPSGPGSSSTAGCSRAARTNRSATGSRSPSMQADLDAMLLTHAHLDHCGLIPLLVKAGYRGPIHATAGTIELATLVLLDSGKLHEEFAKREARWEKRHPDEVEADDRREADEYQAAVDLAAAGESGTARPVPPAPATPRRGRRGRLGGRRRGSRARRDDHRSRARTRRPADRLAARSRGRPARPAAAPRGRPRRPALHGQGRRARRWPSSRPCTTTRRSRSRPGSTRPSSMPGTSSAHRSSASASRIRTAARNGRSSSPATSDGPARRSCATRRR